MEAILCVRRVSEPERPNVGVLFFGRLRGGWRGEEGGEKKAKEGL